MSTAATQQPHFKFVFSSSSDNGIEKAIQADQDLLKKIKTHLFNSGILPMKVGMLADAQIIVIRRTKTSFDVHDTLTFVWRKESGKTEEEKDLYKEAKLLPKTRELVISIVNLMAPLFKSMLKPGEKICMDLVLHDPKIGARRSESAALADAKGEEKIS